MDTIKIESGKVKMIAHRGVSGLERENTCPAFVAAGNRSYWGIETDVHKTSDGKFVIIHDETTKRITGERVCIDVEKEGYSAVCDLILPDMDGSTTRQDIRVPLLEEYIQICKKYEKYAVLELKNPFEREDIVDMVEQIKALGYIDGMVFISFDLNNCLVLRELLPDAQIQWLYAYDITDDVINTLVENKLDFDVAYPKLTHENVAKLHSRGIKVNCWTVDDKDIAEQLVAMGVDYITSNILE